MRKVLLVSAMFVLVLLTASETQSQCACVAERVNITAEKEFNLAYAVFVGKVIAVNKSPRDENDDYVETITFAVTKAWKHDLDQELSVINKIQGCVNGFERNEEWLVYAYLHADGTLGTYCCCSRTNRLASATDDLEFLANEVESKILRKPVRKH